MHITALQPLLILAAIAIVGAVPLLGAVAPGGAFGSSPAVACGAPCVASARSASSLARRPLSHGDANPARHQLPGAAPRAPRAAYVSWSLRRGTGALPPPLA